MAKVSQTKICSNCGNEMKKEQMGLYYLGNSSDVYVFCVLSHKDQSTINPLNLDQWEFYILPTRILDEKVPNQKTISLPSLQNLNPDKVSFNQLKNTIDKVIEQGKT